MGTLAFPCPWPAPAGRVSRESGRLRLRQLDACLEQLEGAHERGMVTVTPQIAASVGRYVSTIAAGITITRAINLVMRAQEPHLAYGAVACSPPRPVSPPMRGEAAGPGAIGPIAGRQVAESSGRADADGAVIHVGQPRPRALEATRTEIDEKGARELTQRIRAAAHTARRLCSLLVEAHERRAWLPLGYSTWADYIRAEFNLSRSRSYELLDHGRVLRALEAATGLSGIPDISPYAATQIKARLGEVTEAIRRRVVGLGPEEIARVADQVVREARAQFVGGRGESRATGALECFPQDTAQTAEPQRTGTGVGRLYEAVDTLANMPPVPQTRALIDEDDAFRLDGLADACRWLTEFTKVWDARGPATRDAVTLGA